MNRLYAKGVIAMAVTAAISTPASTAFAAPPSEAQAGDPRLREVQYDPRAVVTVPVKRGVVTLVVLDATEARRNFANGLVGVEHHQSDHAAFDGHRDHRPGVVQHFAKARIASLHFRRRCRMRCQCRC